jgi:hypothetical protein
MRFHIEGKSKSIPIRIPAAKVNTNTIDIEAWADHPKNETVIGTLFCTAKMTARIATAIRRTM